MFNRILVAYDGSDHARNALKTAATLAKEADAALHVVHTPQTDTPPIVIGSFVSQIGAPPTAEEVAQAGKFIADQARLEAAAQGVALSDVHLGQGVPANVVLSTAAMMNADLIVMGRRGLGAVGALTLGSVGQAVAHGAKCACLTVV